MNPIMKALQGELAKELKTNSAKYAEYSQPLTAESIGSARYYSYVAGHEAATARLLGIVESAIDVIEKYEPYCVPMWVDIPNPSDAQELKEVWLAREFLTTLKEQP